MVENSDIGISSDSNTPKHFDCDNCRHKGDREGLYCADCIRYGDKTKEPTGWEPFEPTPEYEPISDTNDVVISSVPKPINTTTPLDEIQLHIENIGKILLSMGKKAKEDYVDQHTAIANARRELTRFQEENMHEVQKVFKG